MLRALLGWLAWVQERDIEGTVLSFVVCQLTLAVAASTGKWAAVNEIALLLFLPTVMLAAFFLRLVEACFVLLTALVATWYFIVPPPDSFALSASGAVELGIFVLTSTLTVVGVVRMRRLLRHRPALRPTVLSAKDDLIVEGLERGQP